MRITPIRGCAMVKKLTFPFHGDCTYESPVAEDGRQVGSHLNARGQEIPDNVPVAPPIGYRDGPSLSDTVHRLIREELSRRAQDEGLESYEEADDFDIEDDPIDPLTPYEAVFDPALNHLVNGGPRPPSPPLPSNAPSAASEAAPSGSGDGSPTPPPPDSKANQ